MNHQAVIKIMANAKATRTEKRCSSKFFHIFLRFVFLFFDTGSYENVLLGSSHVPSPLCQSLVHIFETNRSILRCAALFIFSMVLFPFDDEDLQQIEHHFERHGGFGFTGTIGTWDMALLIYCSQDLEFGSKYKFSCETKEFCFSGMETTMVALGSL